MDLLDGVEVACFDLFDTLVHIDTSRLPVVRWDGAEVRSTIPILHERLFAARGVSLERLVEAIGAMWREVREELRSGEARGEERWPEIPALEKYRRVAARLELGGGAEIEDLVRRVAELHHGALVGAAAAVEGAAAVLARVRERGLRTALVSNWDHAPAAPAMLARAGLAELLDHVVISEAVGARKPDPRIFRAALDRFGAPPGAALHVGDLARSDAWGAGRLGFRTVWINRSGEAWPEAEHPPTLTVARLADLLGHLG